MGSKGDGIEQLSEYRADNVLDRLLPGLVTVFRIWKTASLD